MMSEEHTTEELWIMLKPYFEFLSAKDKKGIFAGMHICPFLKLGLKNGEIVILQSNLKDPSSFLDQVKVVLEGQPVLTLVVPAFGWSQEDMVAFSKKVIRIDRGILPITIHPKDRFSVGGLETRSGTPFPLFLVQYRSTLDWYRGILNTRYYVSWIRDTFRKNSLFFTKALIDVFKKAR